MPNSTETLLELRYTPQSGAVCAIEPKALEIAILEPPKPREPYIAPGSQGKAIVVEVSGPLCYAHPFFDTYEAIRARFAQACASSAECVILKVNSPGGDVAGAFDTSRYMRATAEAAGKRLIGFTEAQACSSGYSLISAAPEISVSDTGTLGSIGVISCLENRAAAMGAMGLRHYVVTSGARKADGNPNIPVSEDALSAIQQSVDQMAARFFALVTEHRGERLAAPQELEAGTRIGAAAVEAGLADRCEAWDSLVARLATEGAGAIQAIAPKSAEDSMPDDDKDKKDAKSWRAAAEAAAKDGDEDAKKALSALAAKADDDPDKDKPDAKGADDKDPPKDDDKDKAAKAAVAATAAQAGAIATQMQAMSSELSALRAESNARAEADAKAARAAILATRPDLAEATLKALEPVPTASLALVLEGIPRAIGGQLARTPLVGGDPQGAHAGVTYLSGAEVCEHLDKVAGLAPEKFGVVNKGTEQIFGAPLPKGSK